MQQAAQHSVSYADVVDAMERAAFDRAEDCLDQLLLRNAQDAQALRLMAELYLKRNMPQEAARYFSAAILANPSDLDLKLRFLKSCGGLKLTRRDNEVEAALYACL